ncbi:MAG TPA: rhodanese-like domain-containing protein [Epsilonproteobacteria bacterium]|nr:rhodanese-like domain-containing protein [Campylobacterota bacterium]
MIKISLLFFSMFTFLFSSNVSLQFTGVETEYINSKGEKKKITIEREIDPECMDIHIKNDVFWKGKYASSKVPKACKATFITSAGKVVFPIQIHKGIETYGEMEVMAFIKKMQRDSTMLFIDTRDEEWYEYRTIPGAMNIHYAYILKPKVFEEEYKASLSKLGIIGTKKPFDFSKARTILLFCNGAWCSQSPNMIKALLDLGYPPEKIKWYRGGMDDWLGLSMTTTRK